MWKESIVIATVLLGLGTRAQAAVTSERWGAASDGEVKLFTLTSPQLRVQLSEYGARIVSVEAPDKSGKRADVVLGYNNLAQYVEDPKDFFGAVVGRYGNRIAKGQFSLDGKTYQVPLNNKGNALHGGTRGFSSKAWHGSAVGENAVEFTLVSPDGDMGFPGTLTAHVRYTLDAGKLRLDYTAETDKPTVINLTNHTYFNLAGEASGDVLKQEIRLNASSFTPIDATLIPTGRILPVAGTPLDLRHMTPIGAHINADDEQLHLAGGYDHNFVINGKSGTLREAAFAVDPQSGRTLRVLTTQPGVQFYSGNFLTGTNHGHSGKLYRQHDGFCLETQHYPDSPNHHNFPSTTLKPGHPMHSTTIFVFGTE
ncbi:MAG: galactose mutarotase [Edaphobacter sp.]|uniref:aldose epimerase family protein n=1 Tax=Edaphobacter sp. TaxID=1934404 RepID=UPI002382F86E|nr:aldose epimerase family protein [Edaphobacter sp.]MDE1178057.1 galactose mutarotase [Edaphobacter sp.]